MVDNLLAGGVAFIRNTAGLVTRPYETYRRIVEHGTLWELPFIGILVGLYLAIASVVRTSAFRPFLLTKHFVTLGVSAVITCLFVVILAWISGKIVGSKGSVSRIGLAWSYTLVPTVVWFLVTSLLYILLPPPRTTSFAGVAFSLLFLVFSVTLFFWKGMLAYLTLRFALKLDLKNIILVTALSAPFIAMYSLVMYKFGIFKVPFL